ncbi:glycogen synthase kinase-3 beta [Batrachochytrium salamandrivorans]|nr:glycogen synthase kinase-3 beta [Batrachochytrium salamandrivorans]
MSTKKRIAANPMTSMESNASKIQDTPNVINGIRLSNEPDSGKVITVLANHGKTGEAIELSYSNYKVIGNGSFGVVFQAKLIPFVSSFTCINFRSLAYIHSLGICHRDIKPQNLLLDPTLGILKLCDFGSAKILISGEPNVSYICSRYYRAPELIFGSTNYDFPQIKACPWTKVFRSRTTTPESLELIAKLLEYTPTNRPIAIEAMVHPFFDEIKKPETKLLSGRDLPALFDFSPLELSIRPNLIRQLVPPHAEPALRLQGIELDKFQPVQIQKPLTNLND